jgi:hypothetical protein
MRGGGRALWSFGSACVLAIAALAASAASASAAACPNEAVRDQQNATFLPDCRAYEQVSQVEKAGYDVSGQVKSLILSAALAEHPGEVGYFTGNPLPPAQGGTTQAFLATRSAAGWQQQSLAPRPGPNTVGYGLPQLDGLWRGVSTDLRNWVYYATTTAPLPSLWAVGSDGQQAKIADGAPLDFTVNSRRSPKYEGQSADGSHVVFADQQELVPVPGGPVTNGRVLLYEWTRNSNEGGGTLRLVNVDDEGNLIGEGSARLGGTPETTQSGVAGSRHAISADGSRIYFQSPPAVANGLSPEGGGPLYLREDGARTILVSAPRDGLPAASVVQYLDASVDGTVVFFWADAPLTASAQPGGGVYRYEVAGERLTWLGAAASVPTGMASADGSRFYFATDGNGVYLAEGTQPGTQISPNPPDTRWGLNNAFCATASLSGDGRYLAYLSSKDGIFRYDAVARQLVHIAGAVGSVPTAEFRAERWCSQSFLSPRLYGRVLTDDGRVFFETEEALVPRDSNGRNDVYEFDGTTSQLISTGTGPTDSFLLGTDPTGTDVYFATRDALVPSDGDSLQDIYDARSGGGFPFEGPRTCAGEACQAPIAAAPSFVEPGSSLVSGAGGARAAKRPHPKKHHACVGKRGKVHKGKRRGKGKARRSARRCVKAKKHHPKGHQRRHQPHAKRPAREAG